MSSSPWDGVDGAVTVLRSDECNVISIHVVPPDASGRFALELRTDGDRVLRVLLPAAELQALGRLLLDIAAERSHTLEPA
jgi:hypothetical protein